MQETTNPGEKLDFEAALAQLEAIVHDLESGNVSLENSIRLYAQGAALRSICQEKLKDAQMRVEQLQVGADNLPVGASAFDQG